MHGHLKKTDRESSCQKNFDITRLPKRFTVSSLEAFKASRAAIDLTAITVDAAS